MIMKIVQHIQSQAGEEMKFLASQSGREAVAMRVIAVMTVLFLPATFVSVSVLKVRRSF